MEKDSSGEELNFTSNGLIDRMGISTASFQDSLRDESWWYSMHNLAPFVRIPDPHLMEASCRLVVSALRPGRGCESWCRPLHQRPSSPYQPHRFWPRLLIVCGRGDGNFRSRPFY